MWDKALVNRAPPAGSNVETLGQSEKKPEPPDPRSTPELLIQVVGAVVMIVGMTTVVRQIIYKTFGSDYSNQEFRRGMLKGFAVSITGLAIIIGATLLLAKYR
jgi:phosphate/sulfate permease